ncbi:MAG: hypothetical protein IJM07_01185, partial [Pyramidobacter sp.]|nr:hypothetical protein [Pyramidobacter sp.]
MKQTKKALAVLLAVLMLALSMPFAAFAEDATWTMTPITDNPNGVNEANQIIFQDPDGLVSNWVEKDATVGRM